MPSAWVHLLVHNAAPPSLHGVREGPFPRFDATMGYSDSLPSISPHFVSFVWRYHRFVLGSSPLARTEAVDQPGVRKPGSQAGSHDGDGKVSQVPVKPVRSFAMFLRPRCDQARLWVQV